MRDSNGNPVCSDRFLPVNRSRVAELPRVPPANPVELGCPLPAGTRTDPGLPIPSRLVPIQIWVASILDALDEVRPVRLDTM